MSAHDRPSARELVGAVRAYLRDEIVPNTSDRRARFRALIATNVLAIVERELTRGNRDDLADASRLHALGFDGEPETDDAKRALCAAIRSGAYDDPAANASALTYAKEAVATKLAVANPNFFATFIPYPLP